MVTHMESYGIRGADAYRVTVETDISGGLPGFILVGYLAESVREAQERVRTALRNSGISLPPKKITVNLSPAGIRKSGTAFDLAITAGILACLALVPEREAGRYTYIGELGLDGQVKPVPGVLPRVAAAVEQGRPRVFVPREMLPEASLVRGAEAVGVGSILELMEFLRHPEKAVPAEFDPAAFLPPEDEGGPDFADLFGLPMVRLASEAAAAGKHHILYIGPAGTGKTMAASRLPSILPPLDPEESLAVTRIYSICGLLDPGNPLIRRRPFRSPHHSVTAPALIGGGMRALPGELSLASGGVLFLDELPEFRPGILDMLRQALESRKLTISRLSYQEDYPADVLLACAMNPCRCGYYPDLVRCRCTPVQRRSYLGRISGPFLDRIDIGVEVPRQEIPAPGRRTPGESSRAMRERVLAACQIERERFRGENIHFNGEMRARDLDRFCRLDPASEALYREMIRKDELSGRGAEKLLKVARTLADLREKKDIGAEELLTARAFRSFLKTYWGKG
ncbi:YifB family Mg chelatase-like AAA ATPase [Clostridium vitabionis]|uniref:YifB family Mg chelatase-like AAA ATPase n=1 Tax=Clostridium vitabionis TaxID=2784388 RepID=UPI00188DC027|nr:YifB family Mg chelatase-like AAA ATPase [Clostridium vitabionis]